MLKNQCFFVQNFRKDADALLKSRRFLEIVA